MCQQMILSMFGRWWYRRRMKLQEGQQRILQCQCLTSIISGSIQWRAMAMALRKSPEGSICEWTHQRNVHLLHQVLHLWCHLNTSSTTALTSRVIQRYSNFVFEWRQSCWQEQICSNQFVSQERFLKKFRVTFPMLVKSHGFYFRQRTRKTLSNGETCPEAGCDILYILSKGYTIVSYALW